MFQHSSLAPGKRLRLSRLTNPLSGRTFIVPMDHSLSNGPLGAADHTEHIVRELAGTGVNAVVLHKGRLRMVDPTLFTELALMVHLSGGTDFAPDSTTKVLVATVEEALRSGADAVSVHVNIGSATESAQLADLGSVSAECERLGIPLLAMMYARGDTFSHGRFAGQALTPAVLSHLAAIAVDLGVDLVKLPWAGDTANMQSVISTCPIPVVVAGGPPRESIRDVAVFTQEVIDAGAGGLAIGRNVFAASDPGAVARAISRVMHTSSPNLVAVESERPLWTA